MATDFKSWRGYIYITFGLAFGIYRGMKVQEWTNWDLFDQAVAIGMVSIGLFLVVKK